MISFPPPLDIWTAIPTSRIGAELFLSLYFISVRTDIVLSKLFSFSSFQLPPPTTPLFSLTTYTLSGIEAVGLYALVLVLVLVYSFALGI